MSPMGRAEGESRSAKHDPVRARTRRGQRWRCIVGATALACGAALANGDTRLGLQQQRAAVEAEFKLDQQECEQRFVVTSCVEQLQVRRREALGQVRQREIQMDDAQRAATAAANRQRLLDNQAKAEARERRKSGEPRASVGSDAAASASAVAPREPLRQPPARRAAPASAPAHHSPSNAAADERAAAARRSADHQAHTAARAEASAQAADTAAQRASERQKRLADAAERRERIEKRNRERAADSAPAAPLPVPDAGSGPTR